ncbi:SEC-C domain-containing protein [Bosea sp. MMO-172]|uniref:SEC-C domain-containing protein n=1 Tax=Bosea sp. MMO-172 TaxID=3127885 RepID=UPI0030165CA5
MPAISRDLFTRSYTTTPKAISAPVLAFCRSINPDALPVYVSVTPAPEALPSECFNNVAAKVDSDGGAMLYGWLIWEWPRVFIEAEHHAVWEKDGVLSDITPPANGEARFLFLPDPTREYDFIGQRRRINIKRSHGEFASVEGWIEAADRIQRTMEACSVGNQISIDRSRLASLAQDLQNSLGAVFVDLARTTKPNDPCFCTSGRKFKKCCAPLIQLHP